MQRGDDVRQRGCASLGDGAHDRDVVPQLWLRRHAARDERRLEGTEGLIVAVQHAQARAADGKRAHRLAEPSISRVDELRGVLPRHVPGEEEGARHHPCRGEAALAVRRARVRHPQPPHAGEAAAQHLGRGGVVGGVVHMYSAHQPRVELGHLLDRGVVARVRGPRLHQWQHDGGRWLAAQPQDACHILRHVGPEEQIAAE